ncbi:hypothetical protein R1flu_003423 [Riccia fluitans]|uniref:Reverse transcriptase/retrotransposon-derived protein RNase H-like domain-containing protein n=1 Tax=Riccia fluitans TaxID=41844 RepID=A0ABD1Y8Y6_9MARC
MVAGSTTVEADEEDKVIKPPSDNDYQKEFWARVIDEAKVQLGGLTEPVTALVDIGSKINIISRAVYERGQWPIDLHHGWALRSTNGGKKPLYGACLNIPVKIGNVTTTQNFRIDNMPTPVILVRDARSEGFFADIPCEQEAEMNLQGWQSDDPYLRDMRRIGHKFTEETLAKLKIGEGDFLTETEKLKFVELIRNHQRAFAFSVEEIGCVDPRVIAPMVIFTVPHVPWDLKPIPVPRALLPKLILLLKEKPANRVTIRNVGTGPVIDEIVDEFAGKAIYSIGDLFSGCDQFQLVVESRDLTTIRTPLGLMRMCTLPQGATNSVVHMQNAMHKEAKSYKVEAIARLADCRSVTEVQRFLGSYIFYHLSVPHYAHVAEPLYALFKKGRKFTWGAKHHDAMEQLKQILQSPVLRPLDYRYERPVIVTIDTNPKVVGWAIGQDDEAGVRFAARFGAKILSNKQRDYSQVKRELWGARAALRMDRNLLIGAQVILEIDYLPLLGMTANCDTQDITMLRWIAFIHSFNLELRHIVGKKNVVADMLSRVQYKDEE